MTFAGIVLVIVLVAVVVWMVTRGEKKSTGTGPELEVTGEKIVKSVNTSEYTFMKTEYAGQSRGWNIDFSITVNTKGGFKEAGITHIKIERYDDTSLTPVLLDTQYTDEISNYGTFKVDFLGSALPSDAVGTKGGNNTFKLYGVTTKGSDDDGTGEVLYTTGDPATTVLLASTVQAIPETDLNYTLNDASKVKFTFDLGSSSGSTSPQISSSIIRTKYRISIDPSNIYNLVPATDASNNDAVIANKYKFKKEDDTFLTVTDDANTTDVFKIDASYGGNRYRAYTDSNTILTRKNGTGDLVLKSPTDMNRKESETSLMTFAEPGELDGLRIIGIYPGDDVTPEKAIGNMSQPFWQIGDGNGVTFQADQIKFYPSEPINFNTFGKSNSVTASKVMFETIDPNKNVYMLKDQNGKYVSYAGDNTARTTTEVDLDFAVTFEKQPKDDGKIQKYIMKTKDGITIWPGDGWLLNGSDVKDDKGADRTPRHVVVFKYVEDIPDGKGFTASPMTYYSCLSDKDVGCNGAPGTSTAGTGTGYVQDNCYAGSYMYC